MRLNVQDELAKLNLIIVSDNIQPDKNSVLKEYITGANTNFKIDINSKGNSIKSLMNNLNGQAYVKVGKGTIDDSLLKFIGSNILMDIINAINPLSDASTTSTLECAAVKFDIKEGVATANKGIAVQTDQIQVISSGVINFNTETLEFGIKPQAREGVELNLNSLASMVELSGPIIEPAINMSLTDTAVVYSYFATGAATFLAKSLFDTATRDANPCETALYEPEEKH